ncbi:hypothetical protein [Asaia bogorensis]|uniref:Uncharacterized protein n=2 Tax=Asaia TaxID=91914 RepID=A0A060QI75_9PROT|nr:hypothetical protein [Asaia bogorensis]CDG38946.1 hypothetical protein ASAP_0901 [Asaia bogorensis]
MSRVNRPVRWDQMQKRIQARKAALGITDSAESVEALRNKGGKRTAGKRELLRRVTQRSIDAGLEPVAAYF